MIRPPHPNSDDDVELQTLPRRRTGKNNGKQGTARSKVVLATEAVNADQPDTAPVNVTKTSSHMSGPTKRKMSSENGKKGFREWLFGTKTSKTKTNKHVRSPTGEKSPLSPDRFSYKRTGSQDFTFGSSEIDDETLRSSPKSPVLSFQQSRLRGHVFEQHQRPTWCDLCEDFIWGVYRQGVRCQYCRYTCHIRCLLDISLDCPKAPAQERTLEDLTKATLEILGEGKEEKLDENPRSRLPSFVASFQELREVIYNYNRQSSLIMTLQDDGAFHGFVRVQMNMLRPVNVSSDVSNLTMRKALSRSHSKRTRKASGPSQTMTNAPTTTSSSSENLSPGSQATSASMTHAARKRRLSFYLPKGTSKPLHVTSSTTVQEVIEALLDKYQVTDNPKKFALYERTEEENQIVQRRLGNDEYPLVLSLFWGGNNQCKTFSLQEDDNNDDMWFAFEIPELRNFLRILDKEETEMVQQIKKYYHNYRRGLEQILQEKYPDKYESLC